MNNKKNVILITHFHIKENKTNEFIEWLENLNSNLTKIPEFISQAIHYPKPPIQIDWVVEQYFSSVDSVKLWLQSKERQQLLKEASDFLIAIDNINIVEDKINHNIVSVIFSTVVDKANEQKFLDWNSKITSIESKFPGFVGHKLEKPKPGINNAWTTILSFDSNENLENWLKSQERKKFIDELDKFKIGLTQTKTYSGFNFWFDTKHSIWKENMLVLLTLYPVVFLISLLLKPFVKIVPFWLSLFFSNTLSTIILAYLTVPFLMKKFSWWLKSTDQKFTKLGIIFVCTLYLIILFFAWLITKL